MNLGEKTIGILGGMGPEATADLFFRIIKATPVEKDQDHFHVIIDSNAKIPDRTPSILGTGPSPFSMILETGQRLEASGADFLIMPCNTAHYFHEQLQRQLKVPLINMISITADHFVKYYSETRIVGLLATDGTIASQLYNSEYSKRGIEIRIPSEKSQKDIMKAIYKHIKSGNLVEGKKIVKKVAKELIDTGSNAVICGCTEISLVLHENDFNVPVIDPLQILANKAVELASSQKSV
jgi:aspartate racemase